MAAAAGGEYDVLRGKLRLIDLPLTLTPTLTLTLTLTLATDPNPNPNPNPGKLRLIDYLNPMAPLYFAAGERGASPSHTLPLTPTPTPTPYP